MSRGLFDHEITLWHIYFSTDVSDSERLTAYMRHNERKTYCSRKVEVEIDFENQLAGTSGDANNAFSTPLP